MRKSKRLNIIAKLVDQRTLGLSSVRAAQGLGPHLQRQSECLTTHRRRRSSTSLNPCSVSPHPTAGPRPCLLGCDAGRLYRQTQASSRVFPILLRMCVHTCVQKHCAPHGSSPPRAWTVTATVPSRRLPRQKMHHSPGLSISQLTGPDVQKNPALGHLSTCWALQPPPLRRA